MFTIFVANTETQKIQAISTAQQFRREFNDDRQKNRLKNRLVEIRLYRVFLTYLAENTLKILSCAVLIARLFPLLSY